MFARGATIATPSWGDRPGSSNDNDTCPVGEVIIGFQGIISNVNGFWIDMTAVCGALSVDSGTLAVNVSPGVNLQSEGPPPPPMGGGPPPAGGTASVGGQCAPNQVMIGFTAEDTTAGHVHQITLDCAGLTLNQGGNGSITWGNVSTVFVGGTAPPANQPENVSQDIRCPDNPPAIAVETNNVFDATGLVSFGVECSPLTLQ
jgi:hypothetical protein